MNEIKTNCSLTNAQKEILSSFLDQFRTILKETANEDKYRSLAVSWGYLVSSKSNNTPWFSLNSNASISLSGSYGFYNIIKDFFENKKYMDDALGNQIHLSVDLKFVENKEELQKENKDEKDKESKKINFVPVKAKYSFDQIILPDSVKREIFSAMKVLECKDLIYSQWGFGEIEPAPKSIINMYGEPGTGKTMCAHAIAKHLGKQLLALNYAEIESKYVGEAPKNLMAAFDAAKEKDCVLFFDEADSFLGKRIQNVTSGSEQALNSLRSQMLILLEEFSGVVLFATNLVTNFDKAFESRILKHIRFELPNQEARAAIIKKHIPKNLPLLSPFTEEQYMEASLILDGFSGREIKGAILDMLLAKADINATDIIFSYEDLCASFTKKKEEKERLKAEENRLLKEKIAKKLKEKSIESEAEKSESDNHAESPSVDTQKQVDYN